MFTDQIWANVLAFPSTFVLNPGATINSTVTTRLDVRGLSPGWNCFNILDGGIEVVPKDPNSGDPCGANFNPKTGWFNLKTTVPWTGPCELKSTPDGLPNYPGFFGAVAVNVVAGTNVTLVDPIPDLVSGNTVKNPAQLQALLTKGQIVSGVAADGVTQVIVRIQTTAANHQFAVKLINDQQVQSSLPNEDGGLGNPGDTNPSQNAVIVSSGNVGSNGEAYAFAVYRAPLDFARPLGTGFKPGVCIGSSLTDDQLGCRSVSLQVQDITVNNSTLINVTVTIVRPTVVLVHGLWGDWRAAWNSFSPLVKGDAVDPRFHVQRVNFDNAIKPPLTVSIPQYTKVSLSQARTNSLGVQYNTPIVLKQISDSIADFKNGKNPANLAVAAVQVDIVAHSMGGILTRTMPLLPRFLSDATYNQGLIHKVISIDSPHLGSPLAPLLLDSTADCTREILAGGGNFSFTSAKQQGSSTSTNGAIADMQGNGVTVDPTLTSQALQAIAKAGPHPLPIALIVGVYTNFASLDCTTNLVGYPCPAQYIRSKCTPKGDVVAPKFTSTAWPLIFGSAGSNANDAVVGQTSQLNGLGASSGFVFTGYAHSPGVKNLSFSGPTMLDSSQIGDQVIKLLNTPYTQSVFLSLNP